MARRGAVRYGFVGVARDHATWVKGYHCTDQRYGKHAVEIKTNNIKKAPLSTTYR